MVARYNYSKMPPHCVLDASTVDDALLCFLDRIDSSGHYLPGSLQVVCKFANRWKGAGDNGEFLRLMGVTKSVLTV
jgi:hypothetical protein